jgi:hypothetical protein
MVLNFLSNFPNPIGYLNGIEFSNVLPKLLGELATGQNLPYNIAYLIALVVVLFGTSRYLTTSVKSDVNSDDKLKNPK